MNETVNLFPSESTPTASDAISALIKSVRLRDTLEAVFWLVYLWQIPKERPRVKRRVLLLSGEDNIAVGVMECVANWYDSPNRRLLESAATEVVRICATQNWWAQPDGRNYIYAWRMAELHPQKFTVASLDDLFEIMRAAVKDQELLTGLAAFTALYRRRDFRAQTFAELLVELAYTSHHQQAKNLANVSHRMSSTLWTDGNISGQCYYALLWGEFGNQDVPEANPELAVQLIEKAQERLKYGVIAVPNFAQDGIHTRGGADKRFAGVVKSMAGCCRAFEHFGRLSPDDVWLPEFMDVLPLHNIELTPHLKTLQSP